MGCSELANRPAESHMQFLIYLFLAPKRQGLFYCVETLNYSFCLMIDEDYSIVLKERGRKGLEHKFAWFGFRS